VTDATRDHQHSKFKEVATVKKEKKEKKEEENIVTYTVPVFVLREESG